jgi:protein tyrosine phosphatase (PTP) superfamily phosphohydrolase (DUF442 family)
MAIEWAIPGRLARGARPGYGGTSPSDVDPADVTSWLEQVQRMGLRSVICLLDDHQLAFYPRLPGGLLETYRRAGLAAASIPIPDLQTPPITPAELERIWSAFSDLPPPVLIHCSAGIDRTGAAVAYIVSRRDAPGRDREAPI